MAHWRSHLTRAASAVFFSDCTQQPLDRAAVDLDIHLGRESFANLASAELRVVAMHLADPLRGLLRQLQWAGTPRLAIGETGNTALLEHRQGRVERLPREAEDVGHGHHAAPFHGVGAQHLVLDLHLVERVEEPVALEQLRPDTTRVGVQSAGFLEKLPFGVTRRHRPPPVGNQDDGEGTSMSTIICRTHATANPAKFFNHPLCRWNTQCQRLAHLRPIFTDTPSSLRSTHGLSRKPRPHLRVRCCRHHGSYASVATGNRILSFEIVRDPQAGPEPTTLRLTAACSTATCLAESRPSWVAVQRREKGRMVRPARLELATFGFVVRRSIQLSYGRSSRPVVTCGSGSLPQDGGGGALRAGGGGRGAAQARARQVRQ